MFTEAGLPSRGDLEKVPNSRRSLMLAELARDRGVHAQLHPRLFDAYWARGLDLGDDAVLRAEGAAVGLGEEEVDSAISNSSYLERVLQQTNGATALGVGGVPAWVVDERLLIPGAQPHEAFERALGQLGHEPVKP